MHIESSVARKIVLVALFVLVGIAGTHCARNNADDRLREGRALFVEHCAGCHGRNAEGEDPRDSYGQEVDGDIQNAPALNGTADAWHHPPMLFMQKVKHGLIDEKSRMPYFGLVLNDEDVTLIIMYIQSLWPEEIRKKYKERFDDSKPLKT